MNEIDGQPYGCVAVHQQGSFTLELQDGPVVEGSYEVDPVSGEKQLVLKVTINEVEVRPTILLDDSSAVFDFR